MSPLRRRLIEDMQIRNLAPSTQRAYSRSWFTSLVIFVNHLIYSVRLRSAPI